MAALTISMMKMGAEALSTTAKSNVSITLKRPGKEVASRPHWEVPHLLEGDLVRCQMKKHPWRAKLLHLRKAKVVGAVDVVPEELSPPQKCKRTSILTSMLRWVWNT